jgi:murein DD-endopeptidase MepM/ murein hydrolase activator NlpD
MIVRARAARAAALCAALTLLVATACISRSSEPARVIVNGTVLSGSATTAESAGGGTVAPIPFTPTPYPSHLDPKDLRGFVQPLQGACLPSRDVVMPNAARAWRHGTNEGVDYYNGDVCAAVHAGDPVLAMADGVVVRADLNYQDLTALQFDVLAAKTATETTTDPQTLDAYGGRQVWIDHGNGVVTRYQNLSSIRRGIDVGVDVTAGQVIGTVGESGIPESVTAPGTQVHLHVEVRVGANFLGQGLPPDQVRALYERLFTPAPPGSATP